MLVVVSVFVAATVTLGLVSSVAPASAEGFNFVCSASAEPPDGSGSNPGEFEQLVNGAAIALLSNNTLWHFQGLAPPGVPVAGGGTVDPVTGGTLFERTMSPGRLGENQRVDFFDPAQVPGAEGAELSFGVHFRNRAGQANDELGIKRLFTQNFGLANDADEGHDIDVAAIAIEADADNAAMTSLPSGFRGAFEGVFVYKLQDGTNQVGGVRVTVDSLQPGSKIPNETAQSVVFKKKVDADHTFFAYGQKAKFDGFNGTTNQPGVGFGLDLAVIEPGNVERDVISVKDDWTAAPRQVALGLAQLCPDAGHVAWNMDPGGLPHPEDAALNLRFRSGDRLGQTINVDDGNGGTKSIRADEVVFNGSIAGLPRLMDFIMLRDAVSFTRSAEAVPDVTIDQFHMADDDPETADDRPLFATGHITDMPRHVFFRVDRNPTTQAIDRAELTSWTLACPGQPTPPVPPAPDDVRRPDLTDTLPLFPAGCQRHNLAPIPQAEINVQNWLPEDLDAQAATADLRTAPTDANQYGFFATRTTNPLSAQPFFAFGARVNGVQRGTVDLSGAQGGGSKTRVYVERAPVQGADDSARFVVDLDSRTSTDEVANTKTRVTADVTVTDLPDTLRVDAENTPGIPVDVTWRANAPLAITNGTVDAQFAGPGALRLNSAFETGAVGAGPLPPAAGLQITKEGSTTAVHYTAPQVPNDGFPTPVVPAFDPNAIARLHAGAVLTTRAERGVNLGTQLHADVDVPQPVDISWTTDAAGRLDHVEGNLCDPAAPAACAATRFDATATRGLITEVTVPKLLAPPPLPAPTSPVSEAVPAFTDFRPGSGARAVILNPDSWGADAVVTGVARFAYDRDPLDVAVQLANQVDQPFRVNLLDASQFVDLGAGPRPQVLFADAGLDRLPQQIRIRQQNLHSGTHQPWLWINTEDLNIDDIDDVDFSEDPAGTRPRLTGVLRLGDAQVLRDKLSVAPPTRDGSVSGVDARADFDLDNQMLALDASASIEVPRHVALYRPTLSRCDETVDDVSTCQTRPTYEIDKTDAVKLQYSTTSHELGDLNAKANIHGDGLDLTVDAQVGQVPGTFTADAVLANNARLPWVDLHLDIVANAPLGTVNAHVFDHNAPVEYGHAPADPNAKPECAASETDDNECTAKYAVELTNVPNVLHVATEIQGSAEDRITPPPEPPPPPSQIGFVHATVDLGGTATTLVVNGREPADSQFVGTLAAFDATGAPAPVSGFINARIDHVTVTRDDTVDIPLGDPIGDLIVKKGGVIGVLSGHKGLGHFFELFSPVLLLDALVGFLAAVFLEGDITTTFDMDFDLPLFIGFDKVDVIRFGDAMTTLSVDEHHPGDGAPATVATVQQSLPSEPDLSIAGAFFHHREMRFAGDSLVEDFDVSNTVDDSFQPVGIYQHSKCLNQNEDDVCYFLANDEVTLDQIPGIDRSGGFFASGDAMLDIFFTPANRNELDDENDGLIEPGVEFYKKVAEATPPLESNAFFMPDLAANPVTPSAATFGERSVCCNTTTFEDNISFPNDPPIFFSEDFGAVCDLSDADAITAGPRAVGPDGTEYVVVVGGTTAVPDTATRNLCEATRFVLEAHLPADPADGPGAIGPARWSVVLPTPDGLRPAGECTVEDVRCEFETTVTPQTDGSVQVETVTTKIVDGVDGASIDFTTFTIVGLGDDFLKRTAAENCCPEPVIQDGTETTTLGTVRAWVDASGHPGFHRQDATRVDSFSATSVVADSTGTASLDPCGVAPGFGCGPLPDGHTAQWLFGDGTRTGKLGGGLATQAHRYPRTAGNDSQLGILVHYDEFGEVADKAYFTVAA
jgi:hypothetical protein